MHLIHTAKRTTRVLLFWSTIFATLVIPLFRKKVLIPIFPLVIAEFYLIRLSHVFFVLMIFSYTFSYSQHFAFFLPDLTFQSPSLVRRGPRKSSADNYKIWGPLCRSPIPLPFQKIIRTSSISTQALTKAVYNQLPLSRNRSNTGLVCFDYIAKEVIV